MDRPFREKSSILRFHVFCNIYNIIIIIRLATHGKGDVLWWWWWWLVHIICFLFFRSSRIWRNFIQNDQKRYSIISATLSHSFAKLLAIYPISICCFTQTSFPLCQYKAEEYVCACACASKAKLFPWKTIQQKRGEIIIVENGISAQSVLRQHWISIYQMYSLMSMRKTKHLRLEKN